MEGGKGEGEGESERGNWKAGKGGRRRERMGEKGM